MPRAMNFRRGRYISRRVAKSCHRCFVSSSPVPCVTGDVSFRVHFRISAQRQKLAEVQGSAHHLLGISSPIEARMNSCILDPNPVDCDVPVDFGMDRSQRLAVVAVA
jgi:hypothetical protein